MLEADPPSRHELRLRHTAPAAANLPIDGIVVEVVRRQEEVPNLLDKIVRENGPTLSAHDASPLGIYRRMIKSRSVHGQRMHGCFHRPYFPNVFLSKENDAIHNGNERKRASKP